MTKINATATELVKKYKEYKPKSGYVICETDVDSTWRLFHELKCKAKKYKTTKSFAVSDVVPVSMKGIPNIVWGAQAVKYKKETLSYTGKQGTFKIEFNDGSIMMASWYLVGFGKNTAIETVLASEVKVFYNLKKLLQRTYKRNAKPKIGFFKVYDNQGVLQYSKVEHPSLIETVHPIINDLEEDIDFFFKNVNLFTTYGMPGVRKGMLIGPPGTGKTSMCIKFAREYAKTHCVAVCTDIVAAAEHLSKCADHSVPTVVILEDAEATLSSGGSTHSSILNFLDGVDQPTNKQGSYIIMTTNHPERIEARVLKRPGRIDRIYQVGPLKGSYAVKCAKIYFGKDLKYTLGTKSKLLKVVSGMTGAQIKELANSTRAYCASKQLKINVKNIYDVSKKLTEDLSEAYKFAEDNSVMIEKQQKMGFGVLEFGDSPKLPF
jgi:hypothetical protein